MKRNSLFLFIVLTAVITGCNDEKKTSSQEIPDTVSTKKQNVSSAAPQISLATMPEGERALHYGLIKGNDENVYTYTEAEKARGLENFIATFKYVDENHDLSKTEDKILLSSIVQFYSDILNTHRYSSATGYAAIKMIYGMDANKIILIYNPVILQDPDGDDECDIDPTDKFYIAGADGSLGNAITKDEVNVLQTKLIGPESSIYIKHYGRHTRREHRFIDDENNQSRGDTKASILPIQQIMTMYRDNLSGQNAAADHLLNFTLIANDYFAKSISRIKNYKMHVVVDYNFPHQQQEGERFEGLGVDFAQMCPPRCNTVNVNHYNISSARSFTKQQMDSSSANSKDSLEKWVKK